MSSNWLRPDSFINPFLLFVPTENNHKGGANQAWGETLKKSL